jgi:hypothetical protein
MIDLLDLLKEARNAMEGGDKYQRAMVEVIDEAIADINTPPPHNWLPDGYSFCNEIDDIEVYVNPCDDGWQYRILPTKKFSTAEEAQEAAIKAARSLK